MLVVVSCSTSLLATASASLGRPLVSSGGQNSLDLCDLYEVEEKIKYTKNKAAVFFSKINRRDIQQQRACMDPVGMSIGEVGVPPESAPSRLFSSWLVRPYPFSHTYFDITDVRPCASCRKSERGHGLTTSWLHCSLLHADFLSFLFSSLCSCYPHLLLTVAMLQD